MEGDSRERETLHAMELDTRRPSGLCKCASGLQVSGLLVELLSNAPLVLFFVFAFFPEVRVIYESTGRYL